MKSAKLEDVVHMLITIGVGAIGGAVGFKHSHDWAVQNGQEDWIAWAVSSARKVCRHGLMLSFGNAIT